MTGTNEPMHENQPGSRKGPTHSPVFWRACCLAPVLALALVLIIVTIAGLHNIRPRVSASEAARERRNTFLSFGNGYFAIASDADQSSRMAFDQLRSFAAGNGGLESVHSAFRSAANANAEAAAKFGELTIPPSLVSEQKIRHSINAMSKAYDARRRACETIAAWNGDANDKKTTRVLSGQVQDIQRLTEEGLVSFIEAARDNGLSPDDVHGLMPSIGGARFGGFRLDALKAKVQGAE